MRRTQSCCRHNHDTRQPESSSAKDVVRLEVVDERMDDIRKWTAGGVSAREVFKLLEMDHDGLVLSKVGRKKVHRERSESMRRFDKPTLCEQYPTRSGDNSSAGGVFNVCVPLCMKCGRRALLQAGLHSQHIKLMSALRAD